MEEVHNCDRCGALGNKSGICRAPTAFAETCGTCGDHDHTARQFRTATPTLMHAKIVVACPHGLPPSQPHNSSVSPPVTWPQQQGG